MAENFVVVAEVGEAVRKNAKFLACFIFQTLHVLIENHEKFGIL